jgi:hypothetical protein
MSLNLSFGNPNRDYLDALNKETYLDTLLNELRNYQFSAYDSPETQQELTLLAEYTNALSSDKELEERYLFYDENFEKYIIDSLAQTGIPKDEIADTVKSIHDDIVPLILKLKFFYQRIRPYQLAFYYNIPLYPYKSNVSLTPSYPSGHCLQSQLYCEVLGNKYPKYYQSLKRIADDVCASRLYLGVHYPSDNQFAKYCAELVLSHPDFKRKYKL